MPVAGLGKVQGECYFHVCFTESTSPEDLGDNEGTYLALGTVCSRTSGWALTGKSLFLSSACLRLQLSDSRGQGGALIGRVGHRATSLSYITYLLFLLHWSLVWNVSSIVLQTMSTWTWGSQGEESSASPFLTSDLEKDIILNKQDVNRPQTILELTPDKLSCVHAVQHENYVATSLLTTHVLQTEDLEFVFLESTSVKTPSLSPPLHSQTCLFSLICPSPSCSGYPALITTLLSCLFLLQPSSSSL